MEKNFVAGVGKASQMMIIDVAPGSDLLTGILGACEEKNINSAMICYCIGSLSKATVESVTFDPNSKTGVGFGKPMVFEGAIQVLSGQGCIGLDETGKRFAHLHMVFVSGKTGEIFGGHVEMGGNIGVNRLEVGIVASQDLQIETAIDDRTGQLHLVPREVR